MLTLVAFIVALGVLIAVTNRCAGELISHRIFAYSSSFDGKLLRS